MIKKIINKIGPPIEYFSIFLLITIVTSVNISYSTFNDKDIKAKYNLFDYVIKKLLVNQVDSSFIYYLLSSPQTNFNEKYIKINVGGFLKKPDYSQHFNDFAVHKSIEFLNDNLDVLNNCEQLTKVPKEIVVSVIWIETKFGGFLGNHHIPSVYLSAAMADREEFIKINICRLHESYEGDSSEFPDLEKKIEMRSVKKADWALNELKSLEKIYKTGSLDVINLKGSWAGAFGLSQFLPSSYTKWAVDGNGDGKVDLFNTNDAILSVGNYLKVNGWSSEESDHRKALFHYNNSKAYVDAVLTLAGKISKNEQMIIPLDQQIRDQ